MSSQNKIFIISQNILNSNTCAVNICIYLMYWPYTVCSRNERQYIYWTENSNSKLTLQSTCTVSHSPVLFCVVKVLLVVCWLKKVALNHCNDSHSSSICLLQNQDWKCIWIVVKVVKKKNTKHYFVILKKVVLRWEKKNKYIKIYIINV